ncbi:heteromeric transposase endonuclease subunit TnsA [Deinococcus radiophilus]|uniref:heteromeric transposase endonuclease subunit TnsA n=1 Tax=Deinococcus radiophilus TaxID=32062 RepID=UPI001E33FA1E|nr:heteromeric transposase endonuclease subunit TnsA [Deinococcus radiophilus]UFA49685.1 heteromeric transposase endonuclease subunit TnsA [Deinococcus radiophilus]
MSYKGSNGRKKSYVPDTLVYYRDGQSPCLFEVKHVEQLRENPVEYRLRFQAARAYAREQGWRFSTTTERSIRGITLDNITFLRQFLDPNREFQAEDLAFLTQAVNGPTTPRAIFASLPLARKGTLLPVFWYLVASGEIQLSLQERLSMDSAIWRTP